MNLYFECNMGAAGDMIEKHRSAGKENTKPGKEQDKRQPRSDPSQDRRRAFDIAESLLWPIISAAHGQHHPHTPTICVSAVQHGADRHHDAELAGLIGQSALHVDRVGLADGPVGAGAALGHHPDGEARQPRKYEALLPRHPGRRAGGLLCHTGALGHARL